MIQRAKKNRLTRDIFVCWKVCSILPLLGRPNRNLSPEDILYTRLLVLQLWIFTIPAGLTFLLTIVAFWWKEPPIPPAPSGNRDHIPPFFKGVLQVNLNACVCMVTHVDYIVDVMTKMSEHIIFLLVLYILDLIVSLFV